MDRSSAEPSGSVLGEPVLRLDAGGPTSFVTSLAWSRDGATLFHAGYDKVVHVWNRKPADDRYAVQSNATYRVPVGPGQLGAINAIAVNDDGGLLAVGGLGTFRRQAGFREAGFVVPVSELTVEMLEDRGTIYVFDTVSRSVRTLRGHRGAVAALAFAPAVDGRSPLLVSAAFESNRSTGVQFGSVRVWNAATGVQLAERQIGITISAAIRPALAVRRTGPKEADGLEIAVAGFENGVFLFDTIGGQDSVFRFGAGVCNGAVGFLPGGSQLVVGFSDKLTLWQSDAVRRGEQIPLAEYQLPGQALPVALGFAHPKTDSQGVRIVCVARVLGENLVNRLSVHSASNLSPLGRSATLWPNNGKSPQLACSAGSDRFSVAGRSDHSVDVYSVDDLLKANGAAVRPLQEIRSVGVQFKSAGFVRRANAAGIRITGETESLVFDATDRALRSDVADWAADSGNASQWTLKSARLESVQGQSIAAFDFADPNGQVQTFRVPDVQSYSAFAIRKPLQGRRSLLALSYVRQTQPILGVYDFESGALLRQLTSHTQAPISLDFSADGRFLVSTADDQTVCVWSLADLESVIGSRGRPLGLEAALVDGKLVVRKVLPAEAGFQPDDWRPGDVILKLAFGDRTIAPKTVDDYYGAFLYNRPGERVLATRRRAGFPDAETAIPVGQGIDEQKPLFSLFVGRIPGSPELSWIGWSPMGPFDCSGPEIEQRLGWHFNTAARETPTAFSSVEGLRNEFYRRGLLSRLLREGRWSPEVAAPPPEPKLAMWLRDSNRRRIAFDSEGLPLLRTATATVHLSCSAFPLEFVESIELSLDGRPPEPMTSPAELQWVGTLGGRRLDRGMHRLTATMKTNELPPRVFTASATFEYCPEAPLLELPGTSDQIIVERDDYELAFNWKRRDDVVEPIRWRVEQRAAGIVVRRETGVSEPDRNQDQVRISLNLAMGVNSLVVSVNNAQATKERESIETSRRELTIVNNRQPVPPPSIAFRIAKTDETSGPEATPWIHASVFSNRSVRILGRIIAAEPLTEVEIKIGDRALPRPAWTPEAKEVALDVAASLEPGRQQAIVRARTRTSDWSEHSVSVEWKPPTPAPAIVEPRAGQVFVRDRDRSSVKVHARFDAAGAWEPFEAAVDRNGELLEVPVNVDAKAGELSAEVPLTPGDNAIRLQLSNRWGSRSASQPCVVRFIRPPRIVSVEGPPKSDAPSADLRVIVESEAPDVVVLINGKATSSARADSGAPNRSIHVVAGVPLSEGANRIEVAARNREGISLNSQSLAIQFTKPKERPPVPAIEFVDPRVDGVAGEPKYSVRLKAQSAAPIRTLRLTQRTARGELVVHESQHLEASAPKEIVANVALAQGVNELEFIAVNEGGEARKRIVLTGAFAPARLVVDRIEPDDQPEKAVPFLLGSNNRVEFTSPAPSAKLRLRGRMVWTDPNDARIDQPCSIKVWVNGLQQLPVLAAPREPGGGERRFTADLVLHLEKQNRIRLAPVAFGVDSSSQTELTLDCEKPAVDRDVYVIGFAPWAPSDNALVERIRKAFHANPGSEDNGICAFGRLRRVEILAGERARLDTFQGRLGMIQEELVELRDSNAIVLIYYEGKEKPLDAAPRNSEDASAGFRLLTYESEYQTDLELASVTDRELAQRFASTPGAHVLLLDVAREPANESSDALAAAASIRSSDVAVFRLAYGNVERLDERMRLLNLFGNSLPVVRFGELGVRIADRLHALAGQGIAGVRYSPYIPNAMAELTVGPPR